MSFKTPLGRVKGLGSSHHGASHWWAQRVSAVALIPLVIWFVATIIEVAVAKTSIIMVLQSPINAIAMLLFIGAMLYHGTLGIQVVIEDYVHCSYAKTILLVGLQLFSIVTAVATLVAVLTFHLSHLNLSV